jgi:ABC-2 type transport system ATP-binding protein
VAILVKGHLAAAGKLSDILAFKVRGWELVVSGLSEAALQRARQQGHVTGATRLGESRYALELPLTPPPERILADLIAQGAQLVSLTPLRDTLEDFFVRQVSRDADARGLERPA